MWLAGALVLEIVQVQSEFILGSRSQNLERTVVTLDILRRLGSFVCDVAVVTLGTLTRLGRLVCGAETRRGVFLYQATAPQYSSGRSRLNEGHRRVHPAMPGSFAAI